MKKQIVARRNFTLTHAHAHAHVSTCFTLFDSRSKIKVITSNVFVTLIVFQHSDKRNVSQI